MSFALPDVDLSTAMVGQKGRILLQSMGVGAGGVSANPAFLNNPATLYLHNDSGCGLGMALKDSGKSFNLPAGAWIPVPIGPGESELDYIVKYILPNAPVNLLMIAYYAPGEPVPQTATLGNSPVGIGGSTSNVTNTSLSNEGNAANTLVIDIGDVTLAQLWKVWTDHFSIAVDQGGVAHTVLQGATSGNPLQLGMAGDQASFLGNILNFLTNPGYVNASAGDFIINVQTGNAIRFRVNNVDQGHIDANGFWLDSGNAYNYLSGRVFRVRTGQSGASTATITHGLGATPQIVLVTPIVAQPGSATVGVGNVNSTTFDATCGAGTGFYWYCSSS